jgi:hypothetical protein
VKRARELIYTAERQASRDIGLAGLRLKPGSSHLDVFLSCSYYIVYFYYKYFTVLILAIKQT